MRLLSTILLCCLFVNTEAQSLDTLLAWQNRSDSKLNDFINEHSKHSSLAGAHAKYLMASSYSAENKYVASDSLYGIAADTYLKHGEDSLYVASLIKRAYAKYSQGLMIECQETYKKALKHFSKYSNPEQKVSVLIGLGWALREQANHAEALENYLKAQLIAEHLADTNLIARCYGRIAIVYHVKKEHDKALSYYNKAYAYYEKTNNRQAIGSLVNNLGLLYAHRDILDSAMYFYTLSGNIAREFDDVSGQAIANENIGLVLLDKKDPNKALVHFRRSLNVWESRNDAYGVCQVLAYMMHAFNDLGMPDSVIAYADNAINLSVKAGTKHVERDVYDYIAKAHEAKGNDKDALKAYKRFVSLKDSLAAINNDEEIARLETKHEYAEKYFNDSLSNIQEKVQREIQYAKEQARSQEKVKKKQALNNYLMIGLGLLGVFVIYILYSLAQKKKANKLINFQNQSLSEKNKEITDSIEYAKRIQKAIIPSDKEMERLFNEHFILYKPKDIVAGDFYWTQDLHGRKYLAVADCTGHGVPGAMVSVVCNSGLNRSVKEFNQVLPGQILDKTRELVLAEFLKSETDIRDGMDVSLIAINDGKIEFAGANNSLWIVRNYEASNDNSNNEKIAFETIENKQLIQLKANKQPVGSHFNPQPFNTIEIDIWQGDCIYMFSDGYADQFGGDNGSDAKHKRGKKFKLSRLKKLLVELSELPANEQGNRLNQVFEDWRGDLEQIDDVCVIGIRI